MDLTVENVKKILLEGDSTSDDAITFYIELVQGLIKSACGVLPNNPMPDEFNPIAIDVVAAYCNRRGKEGNQSVKEGEITSNILTDLLYPYKASFAEYKERSRGAVRFL